MLQDTWKTRLFRFAHLQAYGQPTQHATASQSSRTILGRTLYKRKPMTQSSHWLNQIKGEVRSSEMMSQHTSLRIGGPADLFILPQDLDDLKLILRNHGVTPLFFLGEGSNLLISDKGVRGIVVSLKRGFKKITLPEFFNNPQDEECAILKVGAGVKMSYLAKFAAKYGLTGIETLVGVPGSLGGALIMNAGAEGTEIGDVVKNITVLRKDGDLVTYDREQLVFEYRKTTFPEKPCVIVYAELELKSGDAAEIQGRIDDYLKKRSQTQPLSLPNSGSVFKNPEGMKAGKLIEQAGLKGFTVGEASVSIKHANFIVNKGEASASDVHSIIGHVQETVKEQFNVELKTEVIIAGDW
ncbi:MAG: UDP-N-acetylmuramate dehydrogenase [Candidatus Nitronauta litoralis]|uniref:UDP-N-acetylenolpyruvoylglucosamine reductase n=1 Tax=Candidatus Nitronauta litoralis TaxID=2705533 RepID=A0A7T0BTF3_9BACT|nr:MAG: UDP-N-acetylmuramate dehydrogenase [Candidatus Nitronauta litoralis]